MTPLPDDPDLDQLRIQAKELKRAFNDGDPAAFQRVLEAHPKYKGRAKKRLRDRPLTLRDAQVTLAVEHGYESWQAVLAALEGSSVVRWGAPGAMRFSSRAFEEARELRHALCTSDHFLLALLNPKEPTVASQVLAELGATYEKAQQRARLMQGRQRGNSRTSSTPRFQSLKGWAEGLAVGMGSDYVSDEHVLLALAYDEVGGILDLDWYDIDADEVVRALRVRGVSVPTLAPPVAKTPRGPSVYYLAKDHVKVVMAIIKRFPPGVAYWGFNSSRHKEGFHYVHGEDIIPLERLVRSAVSDRSTVEVIPSEQARELEQPGPRPRKKPAG